MAKRKTGAAKRKAAGGSRSRSSARKTARGGARKARPALKKKAAARKGAAKKAAPKRAVKATRKAAKTAARKSPPRAVSPRSAPPKALPARKAPALNRPRRTVMEDEDIVPTPPSSLNLDRHASAARSGRREMKQRADQLTQTGPALTCGDVDGDFESAYSVGDEAPGGDNPTPDQDIVDDIGKAVGVEYEDNEELKGEEKISKRDRKRWELDPASSEDYNDRD